MRSTQKHTHVHTFDFEAIRDQCLKQFILIDGDYFLPHVDFSINIIYLLSIKQVDSNFKCLDWFKL